MKEHVISSGTYSIVLHIRRPRANGTGWYYKQIVASIGQNARVPQIELYFTSAGRLIWFIAVKKIIDCGGRSNSDLFSLFPRANFIGAVQLEIK
jgi:hypothetical protein